MKADGETDSDKYQGPRAGMLLLGYLAAADARRGEIDLAFDELDALFRINQFFMQEPSFWTREIAMARERVLLQSLHQVVLANAHDPAVLQRGIDFIRSLPQQPDVRDSLRLYCSDYLLSYMRETDTITLWHEGEEVTWWDEMKDKLWYRPRIRRWEAFDVKELREVQQSFPAGPVDWELAAKVHDDKSKADKGKEPAFGRADPPPLGVDLMAPILADWGRSIACRRVEIAVLRIQLLRLKNGAVPPTLPDFGEEGVDPFTHRPLQYRRDGKGFVVWSVDKDRVDNGGARNIPGRRNNDVVADF